MVSIMNNPPIDTKPALDSSNHDLTMALDETRVSSELDVALVDKSVHLSGEINREMDEILKNMEDRTVSGSQSSCSVNDSSSQKHESRNIESVPLGLGFQPGDMVWGKVKSHPWWPGHIFNEAFASAVVRRSRRAGHVLVAFFGDSSYGWFDPAELIPFEPHYAEKSRQTSSRNFVKAVEEATDEVSRRRALGLACCCRILNNFRPTNVPGYIAVSVAGFESWDVHSMKKIEEARESFRPAEMISFVSRLALNPRESERRSLDWIKMMATVHAYRRAVFEEFDETYAQAFGVEVVRPSRDSLGQLEQQPMRIFRAPLSGPLVIAEALGNGVARSTKPVKAKDSSKKDRYLFKRRDELIEQRPISKKKQEVHVTGVLKPDSSSPVLSIRECSNSASPSDLLQKSTPVLGDKEPVHQQANQEHVIKDQEVKVQIHEETGQFTGFGNRELVDAKLCSVEGSLDQKGVDFPLRLPTSGETSIMLRLEDATGSTCGVSEKLEVSIDYSLNSTVQVGPETLRGDDALMVNLEDSEKEDIYGANEPSLAEIPTNVVVRSGEQGHLDREDNIILSCSYESAGAIPSSVTNFSGDVPGITTMDDGSVRSVVAKEVKAKSLRQPWKDSGSEDSVGGERKKKRKKKEGDSNLDHSPKHQKFDKNGESATLDGELVKVNGESRVGGSDHLQADSPKDHDFVGSSQINATGKVEPLQLPELVSDLLALALDPFHGFKRNRPATVRQVFLRFRSLVYQKSLVLPPASELDAAEHGTSRFNSGRTLLESRTLASGGVEEGDKTVIAHKKLKPGIHEKSARKRSHSEQHDEISEKRRKKLNEMKSMGLAKKSGQMMQLESGQKGTSEVQRERKEMSTSSFQAKSAQLNSGRKPEPSPAKVAQPAILIMKFPKGTALPSISQLKAMFIRFGPLDLMRTRVFYNTDTCKVFFKHKADAKAAYDYASRNNLFSQSRVVYYLKEIQVAPREPEVSGKQGFDENGDFSAATRQAPQYQQRSAVQLKSCLKKPVSDVGTGSTSVVKESPRVKFLLGGEESSRGEQLLSSNNYTVAVGAPPPPPPPPPSIGIDVNKNVKMVLPILPVSNTYHSSAAHETPTNFSTKIQANFSEAPTRRSIDISHQLMSLLTRMNDIVSEVKGTLGYIPYHPL